MQSQNAPQYQKQKLTNKQLFETELSQQAHQQDKQFSPWIKKYKDIDKKTDKDNQSLGKLKNQRDEGKKFLAIIKTARYRGVGNLANPVVHEAAPKVGQTGTGKINGSKPSGRVIGTAVAIGIGRGRGGVRSREVERKREHRLCADNQYRELMKKNIKIAKNEAKTKAKLNPVLNHVNLELNHNSNNQKSFYRSLDKKSSTGKQHIVPRKSKKVQQRSLCQTSESTRYNFNSPLQKQYFYKTFDFHLPLYTKQGFLNLSPDQKKQHNNHNHNQNNNNSHNNNHNPHHHHHLTHSIHAYKNNYQTYDDHDHGRSQSQSGMNFQANIKPFTSRNLRFQEGDEESGLLGDTVGLVACERVRSRRQKLKEYFQSQDLELHSKIFLS